MNRKQRLMAVAILTLTACEPTPKYGIDQAKYAELFDSCMRLLPAGQQSTKHNDWDEVVKWCNYVALDQSLICVQNCPRIPADD